MNPFKLIPGILVLCLTQIQHARGVLPLRDQWQAACQSLSSGQAEQALQLFREFEAWYGEEADVQDPSFREGWLRLWGLAALQAGAIDEGLPLLEKWLVENPSKERFRAFIRFQLATAYHAQHQETEAVRHWEAFLNDHPDLPECALVRWMWADLHLSRGEYQEASKLLESVLAENRLPQSGRALAMAALALVELSSGSQEGAFERLREGAPLQSPILDIWRSLLAPSLTHHLMESGLSNKALEAASWFDLPENLQGAMADFSPRGRQATRHLRQAVWNRHWQNQLQRLTGALEGDASPANTAQILFALRLKALLQSKEALKAGVLAESLLKSSAPHALDLRSTAYATAIESSHLLGHWEKAEAYALAFLKAYPDHPDLPGILFLQARTAAGRRDWDAAIRQAEELMAAYPENRARPGWAISAAGWYLEAGRAGIALDRFTGLEESAPKAWLPFLRFQEARCLDKLKRFSESVALFVELAENQEIPGSLREQAFTGLLKILMRRSDTSKFSTTLKQYRSAFPDGLNRLMVENLAAMFFQRNGRIGEAIEIYSTVAQEPAAEAGFAHEQLSALYRAQKATADLRKHALAWIQQSFSQGNPISATPFKDCLFYQRQKNEPALPDGLLQSLLDTFHAGEAKFPGTFLLEVLVDQWAAYRTRLGFDSDDPAIWVAELAKGFHQNDQWLPYATCQLFTARRLDDQGRHDSADTKRIEILQSVDPAFLDADGSFAIAETARKYDFPEATFLLQSFLGHFPSSPRQPDALLLLAGLLRSSSSPKSAMSLLEKIFTTWPDSACFTEASLLLATWQLEEGNAQGANTTLEILLDRSGLSPIHTAQALLLRARADFKSGNPDRGILNCQRIIALYPAFHDVFQAAERLLQTDSAKPGSSDA